jgi:hypothetical protein
MGIQAKASPSAGVKATVQNTARQWQRLLRVLGIEIPI